MSRHTNAMIVAALAVTLGSCGAPSDIHPDDAIPDPVSSDPVQPSDDPTEDPTPEPTPGPTIRDVDFRELEWREAVNEMYIVPSEGDEYFDTDVTEIVYADVDGDGHEDAIAALEITDDQWFEQIWYIWTWDSGTESAVQVESPVTRMARCGDTVRDVTALDGAFVITEALRYQNDPSPDCASDGPIEITRHVTLEDGWPVLTGGLEGDGGICPQILGTDDAWPVDELALKSGPWETMTQLTDPEPAIFVEVDVWNSLWLFREHWMLVHVAFANPPDGSRVVESGYTPCAWIFLEEDTRHIPHDPYLPQD